MVEERANPGRLCPDRTCRRSGIATDLTGKAVPKVADKLPTQNAPKYRIYILQLQNAEMRENYCKH